MMARFKGKKMIVTVSLDAELMRRVENLADAQGVSRSALIENLIGDAITQEEAVVKAFRNPLIRDGMVQLFSQPEAMKAVLTAMGSKPDPAELETFHRGFRAVGEYIKTAEEGKGPDEAAKRAAKEFSRKGRKK